MSLEKVRNLIQLKRPKDAEQEARRVLAQNPNSDEAFRLLAFALAGQSKFDEAIRAAQNAIRISPDAAQHHYTLAYVFDG